MFLLWLYQQYKAVHYSKLHFTNKGRISGLEMIQRQERIGGKLEEQEDSIECYPVENK